MRKSTCKRGLWLLGAALVGAALFAPVQTLAQPVKIGLSVPLTGVQAGVGKEAEAVWQAFARHANTRLKPNGYTLEVIALDDAFDPAASKTNAEKLVKQGVAVMVSTAGIPNVEAMLPVLEANRIPLVGPASGSLALRGKSPAVFHTKASFGAEVDKMAQLLATMGLKKVAVVTDEVGDRKALLARFAAELSRASGGTSSVVKSAVIAQRAASPQDVAAQVLAAAPDAVYVLTIPGLAGGVLKELRAKSFRGFLSAWSVAATDSVISELGKSGAGIIFGSVVPSPTSEMPGIRASFRAFAKEQKVKPSYRAMEIYITGRVLVEALTRSGGGAVNGARVWAGLEGLNEAKIDGWRMRYSPSDHEGSAFVDTTMLLADGRFR